ncbi:potassium-transporting ATPase subunit F [Dokdonella sp.]|nr:potassium-transporting ATPase subunit F [Dokdonella sp.]
MSFIQFVVVVVTLLVIAYLFYALIRPDAF